MLPYLNGSVINLQGAQIDIDNCLVKELENLWGRSIVVIGQDNKNMLVFNWQFGIIRAFPGAVANISPETQVHLLHFVLDKEIALRDVILWYQCQPVYYFVEYPDDLEFFAVFSLRLQVKFYPETEQVKVISFVNQNHILNCSCSECELIRKQAQKIKPFNVQAIQWH